MKKGYKEKFKGEYKEKVMQSQTFAELEEESHVIYIL